MLWFHICMFLRAFIMTSILIWGHLAVMCFTTCWCCYIFNLVTLQLCEYREGKENRLLMNIIDAKFKRTTRGSEWHYRRRNITREVILYVWCVVKEASLFSKLKYTDDRWNNNSDARDLIWCSKLTWCQLLHQLLHLWRSSTVSLLLIPFISITNPICESSSQADIFIQPNRRSYQSTVHHV